MARSRNGKGDADGGTAIPFARARVGRVSHITIEANTSPCANICRYCFVGDRDRTFAKFPVERWIAFVQRFLDWKEQIGDRAPSINHGFPGPSFNFDLATYGLLNEWYRVRFGEPITGIMLGGLKLRSVEGMRGWLSERQALGLRTIHASFSGHGPNHDRWVGRRGEFDFLISTFRSAAALGIGCAATLFLTKSSLAEMESLAAVLDGVAAAPPMFKHVRLVYYKGNGAHQEHERITEEDRARLPGFVAESLAGGVELHSEREWIPRLLDNEAPAAFTDMWLNLKLTPDNIERLEAMSCEEIIAELEAEQRAYAEQLPDVKWLAAHYADPDGTRIYMKYDVQKLWTERYVLEAGLDVPRRLMNKTLRPPPLHGVERYMTPA